MSDSDNYDVENSLVSRYEYLASEYEFALELSKKINPAFLLDFAGVEEDIQAFINVFVSMQVGSFQELRFFYLSLLFFV